LLVFASSNGNKGKIFWNAWTYLNLQRNGNG
jgi:hypothetical protein